MAFRLKSHEELPDAIRRIVLEQIDDSLEQLTKAAPQQRDQAIHSARKSIKKIRGVLKLIRPELGAAYRKENAELREAGRGLSELRDAGAMLEVVDSIAEKYKHELRPHGLGPIRHGLEEEKRRREAQLQPERVMRAAAARLQKLRRRVAKWPLSTVGFKGIEPGLKQTYRDGRRALDRAATDQTPDNYHEWRKRAKDHWYHARLLEKVWPEGMQAREKSMHDVEAWLGDDHNLFVLKEQLSEHPEQFGGEEETELFIALAEREQTQLRQKAIDEGRRLYEQKPREFAAHVEGLWQVWHEQKSADAKGPQRQGAKRASSKRIAVA